MSKNATEFTLLGTTSSIPAHDAEEIGRRPAVTCGGASASSPITIG